MLRIEQVLTQRRFQPHLSCQIIYEWEDVLAKVLGVPLADDFHTCNLAYRVLRRLSPAVARFGKTNRPSLLFEMFAGRDNGNDKETIIPAIIDFFVREREDLCRFYASYKRNPIVLISSREAYEFLKAEGCPLKIYHWGLSLADKWVSNDFHREEKRFDAIVCGRQNPKLSEWLDRYALSHRDFNVLKRVRENGKWLCRSSLTGEAFESETREQYMGLLRMAKIGLFSTPSMDNGKPAANGFNQVTPRFLEYIASGCHVVSRYPRNADTDYYELLRMTPNVESYDQFEKELDRMRTEPVDEVLYAQYLKKHVTSRRAAELAALLKKA